ncbi:MULTISPECIES: hypothetical protein [unclassified Bradyrhizobium]|uniref:hypothetical protein n=1 Tax=unclassified Bradyrhizobium TaxID=2631580 RepID=UPI002479C273|nr:MULTISPECIES: hypothetical protein [unclassified Bradyrhizobium]WGR74316.1 hypothetical protein MTX24_16460 [Bradyrhizobium sp. ISRA426]WGR79151.1 hypothetical protein MTX21_01575 [Bradyrhizobium sp. ISRA430]WGR90639.1 hypothetical protein MTX25_39720 [Bradyrhizobium sp. ISRA432]
MKHPAQTFLEEIEEFLNRTSMPAYKFGRLALNDPNFVGDLRGGRMPNLGLVARVHSFMSDYEKTRADQETAA